MREFGEASIESKRITNKLERVCDIQTGVNKIWKRNVFRLAWICPCGRGKRSRTWKYLAFSISCSKGWRWTVPGHIPDPCTDIWIYTFGDRSINRSEDQAESAYRL